MALSGPRGANGSIYSCPSTVEVNDFVYASNDDTVDKAQADALPKAHAIGVVIEKPSSTQARVQSFSRVGGFSGLTAGQPVWLSEAVAGAITQTPPTGSGEWLQMVGMAVASDKVELSLQQPIGLS
jgi:hypothetical protein